MIMCNRRGSAIAIAILLSTGTVVSEDWERPIVPRRVQIALDEEQRVFLGNYGVFPGYYAYPVVRSHRLDVRWGVGENDWGGRTELRFRGGWQERNDKAGAASGLERPSVDFQFGIASWTGFLLGSDLPFGDETVLANKGGDLALGARAGWFLCPTMGPLSLDMWSQLVFQTMDVDLYGFGKARILHDRMDGKEESEKSAFVLRSQARLGLRLARWFDLRLGGAWSRGFGGGYSVWEVRPGAAFRIGSRLGLDISVPFSVKGDDAPGYVGISGRIHTSFGQ